MKKSNLVLIFCFLVGCGASFQEIARGTINVVGVAQEASENAVARHMLTVGLAAVEAAENREEAIAIITDYDPIDEALTESRRILLELENLYQLGIAVANEEWLSLISELQEIFRTVVFYMGIFEIDVPEAVTTLLSLDL